MASINLTPKITVIIAQALLFLLAYIIVNNWIVRPFKLIKKRRLEASTGSKQDISDLVNQINKRHEIIDKSSKESLHKVQIIRSQALDKAEHKALKLISDSQKNSSDMLKQKQSELSDVLKEQKKAIKSNADLIYKDLANKLF